MQELCLPSGDGKNKLHVVMWEPVGEVKAVLQISHGMIEFIERYADFANYLNERGIAVIGNDHLGHGHTAKCDEDLGYFCEKDMSATVVSDLHTVTKYAKEKYPDVPFFLFGHSMGSFMARRYLMTYAYELSGAVICGTGTIPNAVLCMGKAVCGILKLFKGDRYRSNFVSNLSFAGYNDRFKPIRTSNDWLTRDEKIVDWYNGEKLCTFKFTINGFRTLFDVLSFIQKKENIEKIPTDLPIFMIAGSDDPVGSYGEGVKKVFESYKAHGIKDISMKLYEKDRHEVLNELDKDIVYSDVFNWLEGHINR